MSLSTHVLDTVRGRPAVGVAIELRHGSDVIAATTD
jgi:5-hydroxyisourate hydrolase-like protein (transthyretin family)